MSLIRRIVSELTSVEIAEHGQIKKMTLPAGWVEGQVKEGPFDLDSLRWFHPPDDDQPRLCLYYRGYPIEEDCGQSFSELLQVAPQDLSAEQLWPVQEVLRDSLPGEHFTLKNANTGTVRGKRILVVEGTHVESGWDTFSIFVDVDATGCIVQELYYTAPHARYDEFLAEAMESMRTIEWQEPRVIDPAARDAELGLVDISELEPLELDQETVPAPIPVPRPERPGGDGIDLTELTRPISEP